MDFDQRFNNFPPSTRLVRHVLPPTADTAILTMGRYHAESRFKALKCALSYWRYRLAGGYHS
jgi:hypothetical protein